MARILIYPLIMKVAAPIWNHRISPVFDTARYLLVVEYENGCEKQRFQSDLNDCDFFHRIHRLESSNVDVLLCGAISQPLESAIHARGIEVIAHLCGDIDEILTAFSNGRIAQPQYQMPGCCGRRRYRFRVGQAIHKRKGHRHESGY